MRLVRTAASLLGKAHAAGDAMAGLQGQAGPVADEIFSSSEDEVSDEESDGNNGSGSEGDSEEEEEEGEEDSEEAVAAKVRPAAALLVCVGG